MAKNIHGFTVLPLYFSSDSSCGHDIFIKEHSVRTYDEKKPPGRTLFIINLPPYVNEDNLEKIFSIAGKIKTVVLQESLTENLIDDKSKCGFKVAYIVFEKREGLLKSLKLKHLNPLSSSNKTLIGMNKWVHEYNLSIFNHQKLNEEVTTFIKKKDHEEESKSNEKQEVDDEGWTVVTKKGRKPGLSRKESVGNKIIQKNKLKSKKKELKNFYTFQLKEQKMKNIIALRKNFQDSKEKVNLMKKLRNFKPF
jgi:ribosomal RNA-processing protein 7